MKSSGIGGQAVLEGVMMKNQDCYAVAVRKPDHQIVVETSEYAGVAAKTKWKQTPIIRGVLNFIDSLILGMKTLMYSASFYEEETEKPKNEKQERAMMGATVTLAVIMAVAIFMVLPYYLSFLFQKVVVSQTVLALIEGAIRLLIFFGYIGMISRMKDIQRVFMYHGAEHKCINCIEHGKELTVENVRESSRLHKRCGTSFLLIVMFVSIIFFLFIRVDSHVWKLILRLLFVPIIAGVSYEFIRLAGRSENKLVNALSKPGLLMQKLTTREPDDDMILVGIASVEAVFDWKKFIAQGSEEKDDLQGSH